MASSPCPPNESSSLVQHESPIQDYNAASVEVSAAAEEATKEDWRQADASLFYDNRTFSSLEEMRGSALESCCPADGVLAGALSLMTTAVTPTMLSIPLAFAVGGPIFSAACMLFCCLVTLLSVRILAVASLSAASEDYETVAGFLLGPGGRWAVRSVLFFYNFGCAVIYLTFVRDSLANVVAGKGEGLPSWARGEWGSTLVFVVVLAIITPWTFNSRLASLRTKGFVSNIFTLCIIFSVVYRYLTRTVPHMESAANTAAAAAPTNTISRGWAAYAFAAPIFVFSYEVQSNVMGVIKDLHDRTGRKILWSTCIALVGISAFYLLLGLFGSWSFPHLTQGNLLLLYDTKDDGLMLVNQLLCSFSATIAFVFCMFPCRCAAFMFISGGGHTKIPKRMRIRLGLVLSIAAGGAALFLPDVARVVSVLGALFSATLSMTMPALFSHRMRRAGTYLVSWIDAITGAMLFLCGIAFTLVGTFLASAY